MYNLKTLFITLLFGSLGLTVSAGNSNDAATFNAASYNLRQANRQDSVAGNGWGRRLPHVADLIRFHGFDIFGTQEGFKHQLDSLSARLPGYAYVGIGRDDGKNEGEHSAIFYRTDLFELLDHGDFWLSEHPDSPGLGWDAVCPRICSWGKFMHRPSGRVFVFFNLHMDHVGKQARIESAKLVKQMIGRVAKGEPAIVTGDFNVDQTHQSYRTMKGNGELLDSYEVAQVRYAPNGTFNSYETDNYSTSRIDHVFVTPDITVERYGVLTDTYRTADGDTVRAELVAAPGEIEARKYTPRIPSDHFPVMVELTLARPDSFQSLGEVFDTIMNTTDMMRGDAEKQILKDVKLGKGSRAAFYGNATPRPRILEAVSVIPGELVELDDTSSPNYIYRVYFRPTDGSGDSGEALKVIVGTGGNDTVLIHVPSIRRSDIAKKLNIH